MRSRPGHLLGLALGLAASPAPVLADGVEADLALHGRFTVRQNAPRADLPFDPSRLAFATEGYLGPGGDEAFASLFVSAGFEGSAFSDRLRFRLRFDSGEVRARRLPRTVYVCPSSASPSGLALPGGAACLLPLVLPLDSTVLGPSQLLANGRVLETEVESTFLLREAFVDLALGRAGFASLRVGRERLTVADGFVYDDYGLGLEARFDLGALGPPLDLGLAAFWPSRDFPPPPGSRPLLSLRADYLPSLFEHAGVFFALAREQAGSAAALLRGANAESLAVRIQGTAPGTPEYVAASRTLALALAVPVEGRSTLAWAGTSGRLLPGGGNDLRWTAAVGFGSFTAATLDASGRRIDVATDVQGYLAFGEYRRQLLPSLSLGAFALWLSGDLPPAEKRALGLPRDYGGFLSVAPYVTLTNVFFSGGISETFAARQAAAPGVNGRGVVAPGLAASWDPAPAVGLDLRAAWLLSDEVGPSGGRVYGPEVDLTVAWSPVGWLTLAAEGDVLLPGDFFPAGSPPVVKIVLGVDLVPE